MSIASVVTENLREQNLTWTKNGTRYSPTEGDVTRIILEAKDAIGAEPTGTQYQRGGLIVRKETDVTYDVYVFVGSI